MNGTRTSSKPRQQERQVVQIEELGSLIRQKRRAEGITLEQAARQCGVSPATLSRLERRTTAAASGQEMPTPDMRTISAITGWIGVAVTGGGFEPVPRIAAPGVSENASVPTMVEAHLRADRNLNADTAGLLARMFRAAYSELATSTSTEPTWSENPTGDTASRKEDN